MVSRIITGGPPLTPKIPEKRKSERSHEVRWKNTFPYHRLTLKFGSPFKSFCPSGFYCFSFALVDCKGYNFEFC